MNTQIELKDDFKFLIKEKFYLIKMNFLFEIMLKCFECTDKVGRIPIVRYKKKNFKNLI